jgi:hypothetical protein
MNINGNITFVSAVKSQLLTPTAHTLDSCSAFLKNETLDKAVPKQCGCYIGDAALDASFNLQL